MSRLSLPRTSMASSERPVLTESLVRPLLNLEEPSIAAAETHRLPAKVYAVMAVTTLLTFTALRTAYEYLFSYQLFA